MRRLFILLLTLPLLASAPAAFVDGRPDIACIDSTRLKWYENKVGVANPGRPPDSGRRLPEIRRLLGWAFGPRNFMKKGGAGAFACQLLIRA